MKALPRLVALIGLGLSLATGLAAREKWIHARSAHFEMFSSTSEDESRELLASMEQFREVVLAVFPIPGACDPRTTVMVFRNDWQFTPYKPLYKGKEKDVSGLCIGYPDEVVIALSAGPQSEATKEVIFHEYTHQLLHSSGEDPPLWLNEGIAQVFSTFRVRNDTYELGRAPRELVAVAGHFKLMPLARLLAVNYESPEYNETFASGIFYAESWALVHYLICGQDGAANVKKLARFTELIAAPDASIEASFRTAFGVSYAEMEAVLSNYLQNGRYFVRRGQLPLRDLAKQIKFRPADDFEREVALLNLHWRVHRDGNATYQLLHLAESHPDSPRPHELLAAVAMEKKDIEGAIVHWRRAADLGSDNAYIYLQLAQDRLNRILDGFSLDYRMPAESAKELRGWLDRAIALDPRGDAACESLVLVEALSEIPRSEVVNGLVARLPRMRSKNLTRYALAVLYWRQKRFAASRSTAESLLLAADLSPDLKVATEQLLEQIPAGPAPAGEPKPAAAEPAMAAQQPAAKQ